ncbi:MAG: transglutaminase family protein [Armatimonadota bacterium]|nr:transglutaminase family protein [Armatimonadota bacterium]
MQPTAESRNIREESAKLPASAADFMLLAAALAVPLYTTSLTILQPLSGLIYVILCWAGITFSYLIRSHGISPPLIRGVGYIHLVVAFLVISNLDILNDFMPGGGFPWQMAPASFMCWFLIGASFFLWTDSVMLFLLVPGIALFGVQSYIETAGNFAISMSLFMVSVAVLLTRLHMRTMKAMAQWAGFKDFSMLYKGPWKAVAGPTLAIVSVLAISLASYFIAPGLGGAVRKLAGEPELRFAAPNPNLRTGLSSDAAKRIGNGPISASDMPVLKMTGDLSPTYLRTEIYGGYVRTGFRSRRTARGDIHQIVPTGEKSTRVEGADVFEFDQTDTFQPGGKHAVTVESLARRHPGAYLPPGPVTRFDYVGGLTAHTSEVVYFSDLFMTGKKYYVETLAPNDDPSTLRGAPPADRRFNLSRNTGSYGDRITDEVRTLAQEAARRGATDYDDVQEIIRAIQSRTKYNLQAEAISGSDDRVTAFLFDTQEGYCDLFASSLTVMCRAVGLRARLVGGYLAPPEEAEDGAIIIRDRHAHLWTEVFFEGIGWVTFDATSGAESVPGGEVGSLLNDDEGDNGSGAAFAAMIGSAIFGLSFLALLMGAFWTKLKGFTFKRGIERRVAPYYSDFCRALKPVLKRPKQLAETTVEYASAYASSAHDGTEALALAATLDRALFSATSLTNEEWANLKQRIAQLARDAKQNARAL